MSDRTKLLIVENDAKDAKVAAEAAKAVGFEEVDARSSVEAARSYLERAVEGTETLPNGIVLDLDLEYESGYELLRYWHKTPQLRKIPLVVWSILGQEHAEMCKLFSVNLFVGKWEGAQEFRQALASLIP
jgi:CheY-like chemotaxis protein